MLKKKEAQSPKATKWIIISTIVFALVGITALVLGFGLTNGWASVLRWFGSRWAIYIYIGVALFAFLIVFLVHRKRMEK